MCVSETTQLLHALKPQILTYEIGDWAYMRPRRGLTMQTPKRLKDSSPVRPASYEVLAMAGFHAQILKDDLGTGPMLGRKTDGPPIQ